MRRRDWQALIRCRGLRETQALGAVADRNRRERLAAEAVAAAETTVQAETARQQAERRALYRAIQGAVLAPERLLCLNETIAEGAARLVEGRQALARAQDDHGVARDATHAARDALRSRHRETERLRVLDRHLAAGEARRAEIHEELESAEIAALPRPGRHA